MHLPLIGLVVLLFASKLHASATPSELLLNAFSNQCPSVVNRQVQGSLVNVQALGSVVEQFRAESQCFGASSVSPFVGQYNRLYEDYEVYRSTRDDRLALERKMALFTTLLNDPGINAQQIEYLQSEILYAQSDLVNLQSREQRFGELSSRTARGADQTVQAVNQFFGGWSNNNACFVNRRSLVASLLSNTLLSTAAFAAPATALGLATGGLVVESLNRFLNDFRFNKLVGAVDEAQLPLALSCVTEAMTSQFCQAVETQKLIDVYRRDLPTTINERQFAGLDLLSRHLSRLGVWLQEIYAGSAITSEGDLVNREKPILQAILLEKIKRYVQTYGTIRADLFETIASPNERSSAIAIGISSLVTIMQSPSLNPGADMRPQSSEVENPIFISRSRSLLSYQLLDPSLTTVPNCGNAGFACESLREYVAFKGIVLTAQNWQTAVNNALDVVNTTLEIVNQERARTISVDAYTVIVAANLDYRGETNPLQGLIKIIDNGERISDYLSAIGCEERPRDCDENGVPRFTHRYYPQIINTQRTVELTEQVIFLIEEAYHPRALDLGAWPLDCRSPIEPLIATQDTIENKSFLVTSCISKILNLAERGNDVYFTKVRAMVSYEMEARFSRGELDQDVSELISATRGDLVQSLQTALNPSNEGTLAEVYSSLESSKYISRKTLQAFYQLFEKEIEKLFEDPAAPYLQEDQLCLRLVPYLLAIGPKEKIGRKIYNRCRLVGLQFYQGGPSVRFDDIITMNQGRGPLGGQRNEFHTRAGISEADAYCALRRYQRQNYLLEQQRRNRNSKTLEETPSAFQFVENF